MGKASIIHRKAMDGIPHQQLGYGEFFYRVKTSRPNDPCVYIKMKPCNGVHVLGVPTYCMENTTIGVSMTSGHTVVLRGDERVVPVSAVIEVRPDSRSIE